MATNEMKVSISNGNSKMGFIPSVSLPPVVTCSNCSSCSKDCYAVKLCRIYKTVRDSYDRNYSILKTDRDSYFAQVKATAMINRYFRWHVSGDIVDQDYLSRMCKVARDCKGTRFLAFTKNYEVVNEYFTTHKKPKNLQIIMSLPFDGSKVDNKHNLPVAVVVFKGDELNPTYKMCGGNCQECACRGVGCWELKKGETIAFKKH